ncbi:tetratricopeptide repeat protein [Arenibacter sp. F26102]|uniref:tetratricopeptide repeat protein n=1 Tax=Arenibacter sp. F26102 TaxID=2926416 RepID=UPI001FF3F349|nr:tetratricopeptide repeat protein [Arenibacter sp. F26102]MCK0147640.1 tetratricopeptide repeat protein [Arenibacter sp. F26102]
MRKFTCTFLLGFLAAICFSQQKQIDSLEQLLLKNPQQDTVRLNLLINLSYDYYAFNPDKGLERANEAIELALRLQQTKKLASAYQHKGHNYSSKGQDTMALEMYDKAIDVHKKIDNHTGVARTTFNKGLIYFGWSDYKRSTDAYLKAYSVFEQEKDSFLMAKMLNSIGINYMYVSDYPKAIARFLSATRIYDKIGTTNGIEYANIQNNIGLVYKRLQKFDKALAYFEKALDLYQKIDNKHQTAQALGNIGNVYDNLGKSEKAINLQQQAYKINKSISNKRGTASNLINMGIAYTSLSQYNKALEYLNQTKIIYEELGDLVNLGIVHSYLGESYLNLVDDRLPIGDRYEKAITHFKKALQLAVQTGSKEDQNVAWENLAKTYFQMGRYKDAFDAKYRANDLQDSIRSSEKREEIALLEMQYEFDKKEALSQAEHEKEQVLAQTQIERQKFIKKSTILGGSTLMLATIAGLILYKRRRDILTEKQKAEFDTVVAETQLKALRAQMNPHFIFNSLNSIGDYYSRNDKDSANNYLSQFAKLIRLTLENSEKKEIPLSEDLQLLELYLEVESKRMVNKFTFEIKIDPALDPDNVLVPPLILQPFIENSIWHGISKKQGKGHILIQIKKEDQSIICSVDDDGVGRKASVAINEKEGKSMGMKITKSRINIINKQKNSNADIVLIDKADNMGLRVEVKLPLEKLF